MKTLEFIEKVENLGCKTELVSDKNDNELLDIIDNEDAYSEVWAFVERPGFYFDSANKNLLDLVVEYSSTPLEERITHNYYRIKITDTVLAYKAPLNTVDYKWLNLKETGFQTFVTDDMFEMARDVYFYSDKEIEEFPKEILDAINCGFLEKVACDEQGNFIEEDSNGRD